MMEGLNITERQQYCYVQPLYDNLNTSQVGALKAAFAELFEQGHKNILLDLGNINVLDSSGLAVILIANKHCQNVGGKLIIASPGPHIMAVIQISQLDNILHIAPSVEDGEACITTAA